MGRRSSTVSLKERRGEKRRRIYSFVSDSVGKRRKKPIALTKVFHGKIPEVTQLDPFVLQGGLEQGVVLKDVVICPSGGEGWGRGGDLFSRGTRPRQREKEKLLQNNRSVAAYKCTVITQWCWCYKR